MSWMDNEDQITILKMTNENLGFKNKKLQSQLTEARKVIESAKVFVENMNDCDNECFDLHNQDDTCRHDDFLNGARQWLLDNKKESQDE